MLQFKEFITESSPVPTNMPLASGAVTGRSKEKFEAALINLQVAVKEGTIRKADLETIKYALNDAYRLTWEQYYVRDYLKQSHEQRNSSPHAKEENDLYYKDRGFKTAPIIVKNYTKFANQSKMIAMAVQVADEFAPFKDIMDQLKSNMTTGRAPSTAVKYTNPNQVRGTCGWCLRDIAIDRSGLMSHHGFERPGVGYQTQSCSGVNFKNLETSLDGLKARIKNTQLHKTNTELQLKELPRAISLNVRTSIGSREITSIGKEDPLWAKTYKNAESNLQSEIRSISSEIDFLNKELRKWQIKHNV
jgi:hypothetical protein